MWSTTALPNTLQKVPNTLQNIPSTSGTLQNIPKYKCSKCEKSFAKRKQFFSHVTRATPCTTQSNIDIAKEEILKISKWVDVFTTTPTTETLKTINNKLNSIDLIYKNLPEEESYLILSCYEQLKIKLEEIRPLVTKLKSKGNTDVAGTE